MIHRATKARPGCHLRPRYRPRRRRLPESSRSNLREHSPKLQACSPILPRILTRTSYLIPATSLILRCPLTQANQSTQASQIILASHSIPPSHSIRPSQQVPPSQVIPVSSPNPPRMGTL